MTELLLLVTVTIAILATAAAQKCGNCPAGTSDLGPSVCLSGGTLVGDRCCGTACLNPIGPCSGGCPAGYTCNTASNQCCESTTEANVCTGNTVLIGTQCIPKTSDGACLNVNCLSTGNAGCSNYAPYKKCGFNAGQNSYFCCQ
uniref:Uncharacterized protein n=1 Tax=Plectus sambesii TaxID=2011161 RepID=A0A914VGE8_9BILA